MANNLHISYDLISPKQDYKTLIEKIRSLGNSAKIHDSFWYVNSNYTAAEAVDILWEVMDADDTIYIVDATNNEAAWQGLSDKFSRFIETKWS